jgi:hypothetical protein
MTLMLDDKHLGRDYSQLFAGVRSHANFIGTAVAAFIVKTMFNDDAG